MTHTTEEWKPVVGFEDLYEVSSNGRVRRIKPARGTQVGRILKTRAGKRGYCQVSLYTAENRHEVTIHSLVAAAFIGQRPEGYDVNHIDADRTNNSLSNLEYATRSENIQHASNLGRMKRGEDWGRSHLRDDDVLEIRHLAASKSGSAIARDFNVSQQTVSDILTGKTWKHVTS